MALELTFLAIGNADCAVVVPESRVAAIIDLGNVDRVEQRLKERDVGTIAVIYITHDHDDHAPKLEALDGFIHRWQAEARHIRRIRVPCDMMASWKSRIDELNANGAKREAQRLDGALRRLHDLDLRKSPAILYAGRGEDPHRDGDLKIEVLHPSVMFRETQGARPPSDNEASMVLRLSYGQFGAIFLGDLDGRGTAECLLLGQLDATALRAHVVKIPHHGAWPRSDKSAEDLTDLLAIVQPQLAVLSVGSQNQHGHVKPELFSCLLAMKASTGLRFLCTEATRTCVLPAAERRAMGRKGLQRRYPCAGDITIKVDANGGFQVATSEGDHEARVRGIPFAACDGRALLDT